MNTQTTRELPLEFRATGGEYFRIWIVNLLLTIVTLGIYSAWAKVRRLRYFYGNTSLDGSSFEYHGKPIAILKGRLIAFAVWIVFAAAGNINPILSLILLPVVVFGVPWIIMRSRMFQMRMTSWRGLRFNFTGGYGGALGAFIGWPILGAITLMILWPIALFKQAKYIIGNSAYGRTPFNYEGTIGNFYRFCLIGLAIAIGAIFCVGIVAAIAIGAGGFMEAAMASGGDPSSMLSVFFSGGFIITIIAYAAALMIITAWYKANMLNATIGASSVGDHQIYSRLKTLPLAGILLTNMLGMIVTLGLFYPWAKVRAMRYQIENTGVIANGDLTQFVADSSVGTSAVGEEVGEFFDVDFGF